MTMPLSGPLNMGGTTTPQSVANELGLGLTTTISMNQAAVRTLAGVGGSGTSWSMNSLYGKSAGSFVVSLAELSGVTLSGFPYSDNESYSVTLTFNTDGTWQFDGYAAGLTNGNWGTPTTTSIGSSYWVRWTRTSFINSGSGNSASVSSGWQQLSSTRTITVSTAGISVPSATYTIEISSDSGGSVVLASVSTTLDAQIVPG